ncbi:MAG: YicC/YloC family endoribonuclease [Methyloceanibacter sp.]|uniref:YicC/YloC family endoribonuclease n=1 Tax=Methyloceanibacter sp. TaxID=1965321 RepID=UPI003D9B4C28
MTLKSMTGFARADGVHGDISWYWEARSVNGRSLDLRLRLPSGFERLEIGARGLAQEKLARGNCTINLGLKRETGQMEIRLNEAALAQAKDVAERARTLTDLKAARLDTLLSMRGVVETVEAEESDEAQAALTQALLAGLAAALDQLVTARASEGERLQLVIEKQLTLIAALVEQASAASARQPEAIAARLAEQIARLAETGANFDPDRLHQEALLLAAKADIQEELDRLRAHVSAANELIGSNQPAGRKFEFLAQEFNREANTICSKAADLEISRAGLELKTVIDQLREQVQNIE